MDSTNIYYLDIIASTIVKFKEFRTNFHQQDSLFKQMETKQNQRGQEKQNLIREQIAQLGKSEISKHPSKKKANKKCIIGALI